MSNDPDLSRLETLLDEAGNSLQPARPDLNTLDARVRRTLQRRRIGAGMVGLAAASAVLVPTVLLPNLDAGDHQPANAGRSTSVSTNPSPSQSSGPSTTAHSSSPSTPSKAKSLGGLCESPVTLILRDYEEHGASQARSPLTAARRWALPGEELSLGKSPSVNIAYVVFRLQGNPPRQVLRLEPDLGHPWIVTRTAACLDPTPRDPGCGQAVAFQHVTYANTFVRPGTGAGVGRLLGQGWLPECARELSPHRDLFGPRGPVAPVSIYSYMEEPSSQGVTVSVANSFGSYGVRLYESK